jgi:aminotransferase
MRIGSRLGSLVISDIRAMSLLCAQRPDGINLGQGVCDLPTPPPVARGATEAIAADKAIYAPPAGIDGLRAAVASKIERSYGLTYDPQSEIVITSGATGGFAASVLALCEPGDEVILFEPYYGYNLNTLLSLGIKPVLVPLVPPTGASSPRRWRPRSATARAPSSCARPATRPARCFRCPSSI